MPRYRSWPHLEGADADAAVAEIHRDCPWCWVPKIPAGSPTEDNRDLYRVRVFYNETNRVIGTPYNG